MTKAVCARRGITLPVCVRRGITPPVCVRRGITHILLKIWKFSPRGFGLGRSPSPYIINRIRFVCVFVCLCVCVFVCLFVCLCVCFQTPPREIHKCGHIINGSKQNLSGKVVIYI